MNIIKRLFFLVAIYFISFSPVQSSTCSATISNMMQDYNLFYINGVHNLKHEASVSALNTQNLLRQKAKVLSFWNSANNNYSTLIIQGQWQLYCMIHNIEKLKNYGQLAA